MHQPISRPTFLYRTFLFTSLSLFLLSSSQVISPAKAETGIASYYGGVGRGMTCAHRTRPFGSVVTVRYESRSIQCRVNDRGPFIRGRVIDLSLSAARALGMMQSGIVRVSVE
jgi:rare lipoprotein A